MRCSVDEQVVQGCSIELQEHRLTWHILLESPLASVLAWGKKSAAVSLELTGTGSAFWASVWDAAKAWMQQGILLMHSDFFLQMLPEHLLGTSPHVSLVRKIKTFATKMVITSGNDEDRGGQEKESKEESVLAMLGIIGTILNLIVIIFVYIYTTL
ncbi:hypothetical protein E5288_WYG000034 [Bos mutus]|uniref:Uncharacterized protein n=1 Tax=Bos mutus TaxID=72004 RepID=A0A6B0RHK4_9CETA|nr:hypothetical protein [Bos mutus]